MSNSEKDETLRLRMYHAAQQKRNRNLFIFGAAFLALILLVSSVMLFRSRPHRRSHHDSYELIRHLQYENQVLRARLRALGKPIPEVKKVIPQRQQNYLEGL